MKLDADIIITIDMTLDEVEDLFFKAKIKKKNIKPGEDRGFAVIHTNNVWIHLSISEDK